MSRPNILLLTALLFLLFAAQAALGSPFNSAAIDEEYHLGAGYAFLRTGDPRLSAEHPPLLNLWNALPLVWLDPKLPLDSPAWQTVHTDDFSDAFLWLANPDIAVRMILLGRLPIIALGILLGAVVFRWTRDLFGPRAALLALALYGFDPNLIAHSRLSSTDLGLTFAMTLSMWRLWAWLKKPTHWNLVWIGLAAGAAMGTKFNGAIVWPMFALAALAYPLSHLRSKDKNTWRVIFGRWVALSFAGLISLVVVWIVYGFEIRNGLPAATYWRGIIKIWSEYSLGLPSYLMGEINRTGWWYYFPATFALKTPLPTLILFAAGLGALRGAWQRGSIALIPPALSMLAVLFSPLAFGYRHILPILPFIIILAANAANFNQVASRKSQIGNLVRWRVSPCHLVIVLVIWQATSTLLIFPHHLSYFNELAGGPLNGDKFLVDSNLDWGQDLPALKAKLEELGIERVNLSYYGAALPEAYGIRYWPLPAFLHFVTGSEIDSYNPYTPEPGWYAISVTSLRMGLVWREPDLYAYFRDKTPVARAGYSIRLYKVEYPPDMPIDRAVVVGTSVFAISPQILGAAPSRRLNVKWADNPDVFIFAMSGPARYITSDPLPFDRDLRRAFLSAAQRDGDALIVDARPLVNAHIEEWQTSNPVQWPDGSLLRWPISFENKLALIGYQVQRPKVAPGETLELLTYWRITGQFAPPVALFAHVSDHQQRIVAQYDGWGTAIRGLEVQDVIVQRARIPISSDVLPGQYNLALGVYSPDTMRRWSLELPALHGPVADRVLLAPIQIAPR